MAVTTNQLETLITSTAGAPFRQRIEFAVVATAEAVASESGGTAQHALRKALSAQIANNPDNFVTPFAQLVVAQLSLASTNMVTVNAVPNADVDTTDAVLASTVSAIYNDMFA